MIVGRNKNLASSLLPKAYTGPGLVDLHINGYAALDFNGDPADWTTENLHRIRQCLLGRGVVTIFPTLITDDASLLLARAKAYNEAIKCDRQLEQLCPRLHLEGPFISPEGGPRGAHQLKYCITPKQMPDLIDRLNEASGGRVGIVTIAPELEGAMKLISRCSRAGIYIAIGHTQASTRQLDEAVQAGAKFSTHLGNGSHAFLPRLDNYLQTQLADDRLYATFIADGHHMPFATLKNFIRAKTPSRGILITDAIEAAELGPGRYKVGGELIAVTADGRAAKPGASNLAGSALTLDKAVINVALNCDVSFEQAWDMASTIPACLLDLPCPEEITVEISVERFTICFG